MPLPKQRTGDFSGASEAVRDPLGNGVFPGNIVPQNRLDRNTVRLLANAPAPNWTDGGPYAYVYEIGTPTDSKQGIAKFDYRVAIGETGATYQVEVTAVLDSGKIGDPRVFALVADGSRRSGFTPLTNDSS